MSGVLVDTSVWVDHFRNRNEALVKLLHEDVVLTHPMIVGEISCGSPPAPRSQTLADLRVLPMTQQVSLQEAIAFIEREIIYGKGCGLIDLILLSSTLITPGAKLWTLDKRLADLSRRYGICHNVDDE